MTIILAVEVPNPKAGGRWLDTIPANLNPVIIENIEGEITETQLESLREDIAINHIVVSSDFIQQCIKR